MVVSKEGERESITLKREHSGFLGGDGTVLYLNCAGGYTNLYKI